MNILFVQVPLKDGVSYGVFKANAPKYPPLGLCYIAAVLEKEGYNVRILDLEIEKLSYKQIYSFVSKFNPCIIGLTSTTPMINKAYFLSLKLKQDFKDSILVLGGPHVSALPNEALDYADVVVRGEGEYTFLELANIIKSKRPQKSWRQIKGISFNYNHQKIHNPNRPLIQNLDELPFPARHLIKLKEYHFFGSQNKRMTTIFTSRGCPNRCTFCNKNIFGSGFRSLSPKKVIEEIELLVNEFKIKEIHICDDNFNLDKKRTIQIFQDINKRKDDLVFYPFTGVRVDSLDLASLSLFEKVGFSKIVISFESGDQNILNRMQKGITLAQSIKSMELLRRFSFEVLGAFVLGLPGETIETANKTIKFAIKLNPDIAKFAMLVPYPGTKVYTELKERIICNDWSEFSMWSKPVFEPENMSSETLDMLHQQAYKQFYLRPQAIFNQIKRIAKNPKTLIETCKAASGVLRL